VRGGLLTVPAYIEFQTEQDIRSQEWILTPIASFFFFFESPDGLYLDIQNESTDDAGVLQQYPYKAQCYGSCHQV
jgi:hypothetical protein